MAIKKKQKTQAKKVVKKQKVVVAKTAIGRGSESMTLKNSPGSSVVANNGTMIKGEYLATVGRRKSATARVRLYQTPGDFLVNGQPVGRYFGSVHQAATIYNQPFNLTGTMGKFAVTVKVTGSGVHGQLGAVICGVSRALVKFNPDWRPILREAGLLTRDDRIKETRKIGMGGKARRQRQSPRR